MSENETPDIAEIFGTRLQLARLDSEFHSEQIPAETITATVSDIEPQMAQRTKQVTPKAKTAKAAKSPKTKTAKTTSVQPTAKVAR